MPVSDYKYGGCLQTDSKYGLRCSSGAEYYRTNPALACVDYVRTNLSAAPEVKRLPVWSLDNLKNVTKVKVVSFLLGLTLTFLIMASYILTWERKGLLLPPSPMVVPTSTAGSELPSEKNYLDVRLLAKIIDSKLEYMPRRVPDEREVIASDSQLFSAIPRRFLPNIKSPCWLEEFSGDVNVDPYRRNRFTLRSKSFKAVCDHLRTNFQGHLYHRDGKQYRLRCLPYFYIIGQPKCRTTDVFHRLQLHPEVKFTTMKEPHWWTRKRFGYIRFKDGFQERFPVEDYLDLFDLAAYHIEEGMVGNSSGDHSKLQLITGEASASTMWDNQAWSYLHQDEQGTEPSLLAQDFIHAVQPNAKIIVMLRDPVERLYSDYLYFKMTNKSVEDFHLKVTESVRSFQSCVSESSLHFCVYNTTLSNSMPLMKGPVACLIPRERLSLSVCVSWCKGLPIAAESHMSSDMNQAREAATMFWVRLSLGMYIVFLLDWLTVFHREQILVLRLEDYAANHRLTMKTVFDFLGVGQAEAALTKRPISNTRRAADRSLGPMLPATRELLRDFHQPFNLKLASVLDNSAFLWTDT